MEAQLPQTPPKDNQMPMDEFETGGHVLAPQNMLKNLKLVLILLVTIFVLGVAVYGVKMIGELNPKPTQTVQATIPPTPSPSPTEIPVSNLPPEYQSLQSSIQDYANTANATSETRSRMNIPILNLTISF